MTWLVVKSQFQQCGRTSPQTCCGRITEIIKVSSAKQLAIFYLKHGIVVFLVRVYKRHVVGHYAAIWQFLGVQERVVNFIDRQPVNSIRKC